MNKKGFVTSALLYGILSLFLVLMLGTLSVISNRKLSSDRLKESALNDVENLKTDETCFVIDDECTITNYNEDKCGKVVYIDQENIKKCNNIKIGNNSFHNISNGYIYIKSKIQIEDNAFIGNNNVTFISINIGTENDGTKGTIWGATSSYLKAY